MHRLRRCRTAVAALPLASPQLAALTRQHRGLRTWMPNSSATQKAAAAVGLTDQRRTVFPYLPKDQSDFLAYPEVDLPTTGRITSMLQSPLAKGEWVAIEKVHGTNFGIYLLDEKTVRFAKRSGIMDPNENFFGYHALQDEFEFQIHAILDILKKRFGATKFSKVIVNGELFGAKYDHPLVPKSMKTYALPKDPHKLYPLSRVVIQEEAFPQYSPELHYFAFDLAYCIGGTLEDKVHLSYDEMSEVFSQVPNLMYGKPLVRGTLEQCLTFDVENFKTPLPALLGLGNYPLDNNYAEGIIIRHVKHKTPNFADGGCCTMIKVRSSAFMELKHPGKQSELQNELVYQLQQRASVKGGQTIIPENFMPEVEAAALAALRNYICKGRASNVVSKIGVGPLRGGSVTAEQFTLLLAKDALKDFLKASEDVILNTAVTFRQMLITHCYNDSKKFVQENWNDLLRADARGEVEVEADDDDDDDSHLDVRAVRDEESEEEAPTPQTPAAEEIPATNPVASPVADAPV